MGRDRLRAFRSLPAFGPGQIGPPRSSPRVRAAGGAFALGGHREAASESRDLAAYDSDVRFNMVERFAGLVVGRVNVEANEDNTVGGKGDVVERDDAPLPLAYGSDRLELMVRDPAWAHAYWDMSVDRFGDAVGRGGAGRAFLRLIGVPTGYLLGEHAVWAERGSHGFALPEADRSYMVELAVMRDYRWVVFARSNVVRAPPKRPRAAAAPSFVRRPQSLHAVAESGTPRRVGDRGRVVPPRMGPSPHAAGTAVGQRRAAALESAGSEPRPVGVDSELRLAQRGSEARLVRREGVHIPFVIARSPGIPGPVAAALSALAAAVWCGRDPGDVLAAGNALVSALADAGISFGPTVAILDPPGLDAAAPDPGARDTFSPGADAYSVTESPDGSVTVVGQDGSSITYTPVRFENADGSGTRSAAAVVGVRHAS
jgi:hypothetical protein